MTAQVDADLTPWYRQPYVWLLIAFPAISVAAGLSTLVIAVRTFDGLVVDDYYKRGMLINQDLDRDRAARERGLGVAVELEPGAGQFRVLLTAAPGQHAPGSVQVSFLHRTRAGFDRVVTVPLSPDSPRNSPFIYQAHAPELVRGHWHVLVEAADWRLLDTVVIP